MQDALSKIRIWQQNLNKSLDAQSYLINTAMDDKFDIIALQEPYMDWNKLTRAHSSWVVLYPCGHHDMRERARSVMLVSAKISTKAWYQVPHGCPDMTVISLKTADGARIHLFNLYIDCDHDRTIHAAARLAKKLRQQFEGQCPQHFIWLGDFNRHHPAWDDPRNGHLFTPRQLERAQVLMDYCSELGMEMALPPSIPTLRAARTKNLTRPDNVFCSEALLYRVEKCTVDMVRQGPKADHFPIITHLEVPVAAAKAEVRRNYRAVDWEEFRTTIREELEQAQVAEQIDSAQDFDETLEALMAAINVAVEKHVPTTTITPYTKPWFTSELAEERTKMHQLASEAKQFKADPAHAIHAAYRKQRNRYTDLQRYSKKDCWVAFLENTDDASIWKTNRFISKGPTDGGKSCIPAIRARNEAGQEVLLTDNDQKGAEFYKTFFLLRVDDTDNADGQEYLAPKFEFQPITDEQIHRAIRQLKSFKVPGPDGIPNEVYRAAADVLVPVLGRLFRATFELQYYPEQWKISDTVVLRKPGKSDYTVAKAYRGVALLSCLSKILSKCVANVLVYHAEKHNMLPNHQFGGRTGRQTTDSLHLVQKTVKDAWRRGKVAAALFLDIKSAFPAAVPEKLFHILRMRGVPEEYVCWLRIKLAGRKTRLRFDDFASDIFLIQRGIDQGCPLSVILYAFYNAALIEAADPKKGETAEGSMDDAAVLVVGDTLAAVHTQMRDFMERPGGGEDWSETHHSPFSADKFGLVNFAPKLSIKRKKLGPPLQLRTHRVEPSPYHRFLGVLVDCELRHHPQVAEACAKGAAWAALMRRMGQSRHGMPMKVLLRLYQSVAVPRILYAADTFLAPIRTVEGRRAKSGSVGHIKKLAQVQRQAAIIITGSMRTAATDALEAHLCMLPMDLLVDKVCFRAAARLCALPVSHPLHAQVKRASKPVAAHRSKMHELLQIYAPYVSQDRMEKIEAVRHPPHWEPAHLVDIADSKDDAAASEERWARRDGLRVYSDGSEMEGGVGAAAVLFNERTRKWNALRLYLGPAEEHTVYEAETVGAILGTELVRKSRKVGRTASVALDGKSAIEGSLVRESRPGHYLTDLLHSSIATTKKRHTTAALTLRWVPGHQDIQGNQQADAEAKLAALGESSSIRGFLTSDHHQLGFSHAPAS